MKDEVKSFNIEINRSSTDMDIPHMVVDQIVNHISEGTLQPGDKLPSELEMTRRFKISRISLREAMKLLEARGYIEAKGRQGKYIKSVVDNAFAMPIQGLITSDDKNLNNLLEVKKIIDGESAYMAAVRANKDEIENLNSLISKMEKISQTDENKKNLRYEAYSEFYHTLAKSTQNTIFTHMLISIAHILKEVFLKKEENLFTRDGEYNQLVNLLKEVVTSIAANDTEKARELMISHIDLF